MTDLIRVIALEGSHGVGKSTIIEELKRRGYTILEEGFMSDDAFDDYVGTMSGMSNLSGHSFAMELSWVGNMFKSIYRLVCLHKAKKISLKDNVIFTDRSYLTPQIYGALPDNAELAFSIVCETIKKDAEKDLGITYCPILLVRPSETKQFEVILKRLAEDTTGSRAALNEGEFDHLTSINERYQRRLNFFKRVIKMAEYYTTSTSDEVSFLLAEIKLIE